MFDRLVCPAYPNCDEWPLGCCEMHGDEAEFAGLWGEQAGPEEPLDTSSGSGATSRQARLRGRPVADTDAVHTKISLSELPVAIKVGRKIVRAWRWERVDEFGWHVQEEGKFARFVPSDWEARPESGLTGSGIKPEPPPDAPVPVELQEVAARSARWRKANRERYNAYMKVYMRKRRLG